MTQLKRLLLSLAAVSIVCTFVQAQRGSSSKLSPVSRTYALENINIVTTPEKMIENGTVLIKNGLIAEVGINVKIPGEAIKIAADSMYVYAGFIDGLSHTGIEDEERDNSVEVDNPGVPPNDIAGIQPERSAQTLLDPTEKSISEMREIGFTVAHVVPEGRMLPGQGAIILLTGASAEEMILKAEASLFSQFRTSRRVYPSTIIGLMAKWRQLYRQAELSKAHETAYENNPAGMGRPQRDPVIQAFYPVIDQQLPVFFKANDVKSVHRALTLKNDLGFQLVVAGLKQGWDLAEILKTNNIPTFISLDLPANKDESKKKQNEESDDIDPEIKALKERRAESYKQYHSQASMLAKAGVSFGFAAIDAKAKDIRANLRSMIEHGLDENTALAALTTKPAQMLGISNIVGTVEKGKIANLVVSDKPYFDESSNVRYVFVDGIKYEYEVKEKKKGNPNAEVNAAGFWEYTADIDEGGEGSFTIEGEGENLSGFISVMGEDITFSSVVLDGNELTLNFEADAGGQALPVTINGVIEDNSFEGSITAGDFGTFEFTAERESAPD